MLSIITLICSSIDAKGQHTMFVDLYSANDQTRVPVFDTVSLAACAPYLITIEGTFSIWAPSYWSGPCGLIETSPMYPSPVGYKTGNVGFDMEYVFSLPKPSVCAGKVLPYRQQRIEISTDGGLSWFVPADTNAYSSSHVYQYVVGGEGKPIGFRHVSTLSSDDYGKLEVDIEAIEPHAADPLGPDTSLCEENIFRLSVGGIAGDYQWQDGSTDSVLDVISSGQYWVQIDNGACIVSDTILVTFIESPTVELGNDTLLCEGQSMTLHANSKGSNYSWQDGSTDSVYIVDRSGLYSLIVYNQDCWTKDSMIVQYDSAIWYTLSADTTLCENATGELVALSNSNIQWDFQLSNNSKIEVNSAGTYSVTFSNACGQLRDSISVTTRVCGCEVYMPNAFSPNKDDLNELFGPKYDCQFTHYELVIYSRWGELLFRTNEPEEKWDGSYRGKAVQDGVYLWLVSYGFTNDRTIRNNRDSGTLTLLR